MRNTLRQLVGRLTLALIVGTGLGVIVDGIHRCRRAPDRPVPAASRPPEERPSLP